MNNNDPVYNGIVIKKRILGNAKEKIRNGVLIQPEGVFGNSQTLIQKPVIVSNANEIIYISGKHIIIHNTKNSIQSFIYKKTPDREITALNYSNENHQMKIAVSVSGNA